MLERFDLLVRNGTVVGAGPTRPLDVGIRDGRIAALADPGALTSDAAATLDATGLHVLPGVIDGHVHFREPGLERKGDWLTESRAAVMGGVTTVLDMPNTQPPTRDVAAAEQKVALASAKSLCDFGLFGLVDADFEPAVLATLVESGLVIGLKVFLGPTTGGMSAPSDEQLATALRIARDAGLRVGFHAEDAQVLSQATALTGKLSAPRDHVDARPVAAEVAAIDHVGRLLAVAGAAGHIFHLSSADGLATVERWRGQGADLTCEVAPHHLFLGLADYERVGGALKVNPPVRGEPHASALLAALADGRIDCVASDHAPHTPAEKLNDDIADVAAGIAGVETMLPLLLTAVRAGRLTLERLVDATSAAPARSWRLAGKGVLAVGADADLTLVDLARAGLIRAADLHGKHQLTPFDGAATIGEPAAAIVRGRPVMLDGQFVATPGVGSRVVHGRASSQPAHSIHE